MKKHFPVIALVLSLFCFAGTLVRPFIIQGYAKVQGADGGDVFIYRTDVTSDVTMTNSTIRFGADGTVYVMNSDGTPQVIVNPDGGLSATYIESTGSLGVSAAGPFVNTVSGHGLQLKEGADSVAGATNLTGGSVVIPTASVTDNSWIFPTRKEGGVLANVGNIGVTARTAGTSFTVTSVNVLDTESFVWMIVEPAP